MWQAIGASVQGTGHVRQGLPCQDACHWQVSDEHLVVAVGDGLGSALYADVGARLAVETSVTHLATHLVQTAADDAEAWGYLVQSAYAIGQKLSISQNCQINFASKTLKI